MQSQQGRTTNMPLKNKTTFYPWICWFLAAVFYFFQYGLLAIPSVLSADFQTSLLINTTELSILYSAFLYTYVFMQVPVGLMFDRYRSRNILFIATLLLALGCLLLAVSHTLWVGILARMVMGVGGSFAFVGALYLGRTWFSVLIFPLIVGMTESMSGLSEVGLLPFIAYLNKLQHWRIIHVEFGMVVILLATLIFFTVSDKRKERVKVRTFSVKGELKLILRSPVVWLLSIFSGCTFVFVMSIANMWGAPLLAAYYHIPIWKAAIESGMVMLGYTVGCFGIGWIARYVSDRLLILIFATIQFVTMMVFWYFEFDLTAAGVLLFIIGLSSASIPIVFDYLKKIVPISSYGVSCGFLNMFFGGFGILLSPVVGYIFETTKNVYLSFVPALVCSFFALVVAVILREVKIKPITPEKERYDLLA